MGGCCCSTRRPQLNGAPIYYYCPSLSEHESLTSNDSAATALTAGFLADLNLDMSSPDTYRSPPRPIPFDVVLGFPRSSLSDSIREPGDDVNFEKAAINLKGCDLKVQSDVSLLSSRGTGMEHLKSSPLTVKEEVDCCPTCLEEYDVDNPRIVTKCNHHFHLSCILEWMERSDTCPLCNQEMMYETL